MGMIQVAIGDVILIHCDDVTSDVLRQRLLVGEEGVDEAPIP